jgi:hypothetical protein
MAASFDPAALAAAPDGGAALLEALMHGVARAGDAPLLIQLAAAMQLRGLRLSANAHRSLLHVLSRAGRREEALAWLAERVPADLLSWEHVVAVARPAEQDGDVALLRRTLDAARARGVADPAHALAGVRLALAGAEGGVAGAEGAWRELAGELAAAGRAPDSALLARRVFVLHGLAVGRDKGGAPGGNMAAAHGPMVAATRDLLAHLESSSGKAPLGAATATSSSSNGRDQLQLAAWWEQPSTSSSSSDKANFSISDISDISTSTGSSSSSSDLFSITGAGAGPAALQGDPAAPWGAPTAEQETVVKALDAAAGVAAKMLDEAAVAEMVARRDALGLPPTVQLFRALLSLQAWGRGTPETVEVRLAGGRVDAGGGALVLCVPSPFLGQLAGCLSTHCSHTSRRP